MSLPVIAQLVRKTVVSRGCEKVVLHMQECSSQIWLPLVLLWVRCVLAQSAAYSVGVGIWYAAWAWGYGMQYGHESKLSVMRMRIRYIHVIWIQG